MRSVFLRTRETTDFQGLKRPERRIEMAITELYLRTYQTLIDEIGDERIKALVSAHGVKLDEIVTKDFYDVLREEGYEVA